VATWTISETASKTGLSAHTLRWYERIGLLDRVRRGGDGRRRFTEEDLGWLGTITKLRDTGMPVRDMQRYAELVRSGAGQQERIELLRRHREHVLQALQAQQDCLRLVEYKIDFYERQLSGEVNQACEP
jgi:DNA-binding transcriptional MerR regulator